MGALVTVMVSPQLADGCEVTDKAATALAAHGWKEPRQTGRRRMNRPRTPEHFPKMKHRAAGRAIRKQQAAATAEALPAFTVMADNVYRGLIRFVEAFGAFAASFSSNTRDDYALLPENPR